MSVPVPYYQDGAVCIYWGDCREVLPLITKPDLVLTDPPYGIGWRKSLNKAAGSRAHDGIQGDDTTAARDWALEALSGLPAIVFGSFAAAPPAGLVQTLVWQKPADAGVVGSVTGFRRDAEAIYLCGTFPKRTVQWSSVLRSTAPMIGGTHSPAGRTGHPHAKPLDLIVRLMSLVDGAVLDPFMGSGTTLVAAKRLGRKAVGIEIERAYCDIAVERLRQSALPLELPA
jgi:DNA modification methylase